MRVRRCFALVFAVALVRAARAEESKANTSCIGGAYCDPGDTCCQDAAISVFYGCCPSDHPICCPDHRHCCTDDFPLCAAGGMCQNFEGRVSIRGVARGLPAWMAMRRPSVRAAEERGGGVAGARLGGRVSESQAPGRAGAGPAHAPGGAAAPAALE